jgi:hypothetical protein
MDISSERLAYWYLRLNGFLTTYNFVVHPDEANQQGRYHQRTDVDVMAVRFPHRQENRARPMADADWVQGDSIRLVLAEAKSGTCRLNPTWRDPSRENMEKVLSAAGIVPGSDVDVAAASLYEYGVWRADGLVVHWLCFGLSESEGLLAEFPEVPQLLWSRDVLPFVHERFKDYRLEKSSHKQWDDDAKGLYEAALNTDVNTFLAEVTVDGKSVL